MRSEPLVSVLVITYNQEKFIEEALRSALEQDYDNLEVVVGDDASTDRTPEIIMDLASEYPDRLVPILGKERLGITGNSNRVLRRCRGKYIAFMGGDDVFLPGKIKAQVSWLEEDERRVICAHQVNLTDENGRRIGLLPNAIPPWAKENRGNRWLIRYGNFLPGCSIMARRSSLPIYGFDERFPLVSDWKLWIDTIGHEGIFGFIDGVSGCYRVQAEGVTKAKKLSCILDSLKTLAITAWEDKRLAFIIIPSLLKRLYLLGYYKFQSR
ncbi:glycosyltransferase [Candidatus Parcubacteria bacterium]|nr:MAG: glycosyltransferase [Candidatus Parcubacteria bacterium]